MLYVGKGEGTNKQPPPPKKNPLIQALVTHLQLFLMVHWNQRHTWHSQIFIWFYVQHTVAACFQSCQMLIQIYDAMDVLHNNFYVSLKSISSHTEIFIRFSMPIVLPAQINFSIQWYGQLISCMSIRQHHSKFSSCRNPIYLLALQLLLSLC